MKIERLLFLSTNKCFYCGKSLTNKEVTIEHIIPKSSGGKDNLDNLAVCCRSINQMLSDISPKKKIELVMAGKGLISCPEDNKKTMRKAKNDE
jgi:DNA-directed RNA polymerase subunit N (RpoN/RPB10)